MNICDYNKCTGCYGCVNVCPQHCVKMIVDDYGENHPFVNENRCIKCGTCIDACPNNNKCNFEYPQKCLAVWMTNTKERSECASGGVATIISKHIIQNRKGVVFGTCYNEKLQPVVQYTETLEGLEKFKGSKYVQSIVGENTFNIMEEFIHSGKTVLFVGTPCQIAATKLRMGKYENFYTVDLICHGVSPTKFFDQEVGYLVAKHSLKNVVNVRFRGNDNNNYRFSIWNSITKRNHNNYVLTLWKNCGGVTERVYRAKPYNDYYLSAFLMGVSLRESCYFCSYARPERVSDITTGDFIGLGKKKPFEYDVSNVSSVFINSDKGLKLWKEISENKSGFVSVERDYKERLEYGPSLRHPYKRSEFNKEFREQFKKSQDFPKSIRIVLKGVMLKKFFSYIFGCWTLVYRVPRKIWKLLNEK